VERIMSADLFRPASRLAGALLGLVAFAPVAGGFSPGRDAASSPLPLISQAQAQPPAAANPPAPGQSSADELFQSGVAALNAKNYAQAISQFQKVLDATDKGTKAAGELYLALGETYRRKNDLASAISALKSARLTLPDDPRVLSTLALLLEATSSWEAQQAYEDALRVAPNDAILLNNLAFSLAEHGGDLDRALTLARRAQKLAPTMPEMADTVGWIYLKKDMAYEARAAFAPLVQQQPGNAGFRGHLATALEWRNETSAALRALAKALRQEPTEANQRLVLELLKSSGLPASR
jgi:Flp pilus assembly protein TadD